MLAAEAPARTIIKVLGHSEISVTMNTHAQVLAQLAGTPPTRSTEFSAPEVRRLPVPGNATKLPPLPPRPWQSSQRRSRSAIHA
jgi:hypothetical protein